MREREREREVDLGLVKGEGSKTSCTNINNCLFSNNQPHACTPVACVAACLFIHEKQPSNIQ